MVSLLSRILKKKKKKSNSKKQRTEWWFPGAGDGAGGRRKWGEVGKETNFQLSEEYGLRI